METVEVRRGESLFRLMKLVRETQCEMEVVKPVLDELEVMRLCRGFGMMTSVNPKDFDFDILHAREFDEDFIRFLRYELLESSCPGMMRFKGLFGKQAQVAAALIDMKACSSTDTAWLAQADEGVYCVKFEMEIGEATYDDRDKDAPCLVVFSWIHDELFEPQGLRNTPAFVLRFLTVLTPDIVCCTSLTDLQQIKSALVSSDGQDDDDLSSYSVSFHIEKQVDQSDATECVAVDSIDLEELPEDCSCMTVLKGSYPAIAFTRVMDSEIRTEPVCKIFQRNKLSFAAWLKTESQQYRIDLSPAISRSEKLCRSILVEFGIWSEEHVMSLRAAHDKQEEKYNEAAQKVTHEIEKQRAMIDHFAGELFQLHVGKRSDEVSGASSQIGSEAYDECQAWLKTVWSWEVDPKLLVVLQAPSRLREMEATLFEFYTCGHEEKLRKLVEMCATATKPEIDRAMSTRQDRTSSMKISLDVEQKDKADDQTDKWGSFLKKMAEPLAALQTKWRVAVESALAVEKNTQIEKLKTEQKTAKSIYYENEKKDLADSIDKLRQTLMSKDGLLLSVSAQTRGKGNVYCEGTRQVHAPPTAFQNIVKLNVLDTTKRLEMLGRFLLPPQKNLVSMFTVKVRSVVHVCTSKERMWVKFTNFPSSTNPSRPSHANEKVIRKFGQFASVCDLDARNRIMTFLFKTSVGVYKFDESFKKMELMKTVDLDMRSTLTDPPFTDVLLLDSTLYLRVDVRRQSIFTIIRHLM